MYRRRELQERFNISVGKRYRAPRQSTDTGTYKNKKIINLNNTR